MSKEVKSTFSIDKVIILTEQAEKLKSGLYAVKNHIENNKIDLKGLYNDLFGKKKAKKELRPDEIDKYGKLLRYPFLIVKHFYDFQNEARSELTNVTTACKEFDLSWDYPFVRTVLSLFINTIKINIFILKGIPGISKLPAVYGYLYEKRCNESLPSLKSLEGFISVDNFKKFVFDLEKFSELAKDMIMNIAKPLINIIKPSEDFPWKMLNITDDPPLSDGKNLFFSIQYIILMELPFLYDFLTCFFLINPTTCEEPLLEAVFKLVLNYTNVFVPFGDVCLPIKDLFEIIIDFRKNKKDVDLKFIDSNISKGAISERRVLRWKRLAMALDECFNAAQLEPNLLGLKLPIVLSILGYSAFECNLGLLCINSKYQLPLIGVLSNAQKLITLFYRQKRIIERFLLFNLREYDAPYLYSMICSYTLPDMNSYNLTNSIITALNSVDIEKFDQGYNYDLTGTLITLIRLVTQFNIHATSHGVNHLQSLFNLISGLYFRLQAFISPLNRLFMSAPFNQFWALGEQIVRLSSELDSPDTALSAGFLGLTTIFTFDTNAISENKDMIDKIKDIGERLIDNILRHLSTWGEEYFNNGLKQLSEQENSITTSYLPRPKTKENEDKKKGDRSKVVTQELKDLTIGEELDLSKRQLLNIIDDPETRITKLMKEIRFMGKIDIFGTKYDLVPRILDIVQRYPEHLCRNIQPPTDLINTFDSLIYLQQFVLSSLGCSSNSTISKCVSELRKCNVVAQNNYVQIEGNTGYLITSYVDFYSKHLRDSINLCIYSNTNQTFVPIKVNPVQSNQGPSLKISPQHYFSRTALEALYNIIGVEGMIALDIAAADIAANLIDKLAMSIEPILKLCSQAASNPDQKDQKGNIFDPTGKGTDSALLKEMFHIAAVLQFRKMIRTAIKSSQKYPFMNANLPPHRDIILTSRLANSKIFDMFTAQYWTTIWSYLWASDEGTEIDYYVEHDAFNSNLHLVSLLLDAVYGTMLTLKKINIQKLNEQYQEMVRTAHEGIENAILKYKENKKVSYNDNIMKMALDHLVKSSYYADYNMLEMIVSYQYIRSIYTAVLRNYKGK